MEKDIEVLKADIAQAEITSSDQSLKRAEILEEIKKAKNLNKEIEKTIFTYNDEEMKLRRTVAANNEKVAELSGKRAMLEKRSAELRQLERDKSAEKEQIGRELARLEERNNNLNKQYDDITKKLW